jgi:geranylgeranyl diphosphate synthase, type II
MTNVSSIPQLLKSFEEYLQSEYRDHNPQSLYQPVEYILSLGGKRLRPLSILYCTEILNGNQAAAMNAACAIELFHNFSLIHDDIMDEATLRRSKPTVHKKFGINAAILSGDVMMIKAMHFMLKAESISGYTGLQALFIDMARKVCEGQAMDMEFEGKSMVAYPEYLEMIRLKTAVLLATGFKMTALMAGRNDLADVFYDMGIYTGFYAEDQASGKIKAGDIIQSKKSALILELFEEFDAAQKTSFVDWYHSPHKSEYKIKKMEDYFIQFNTKEKLRNRITTYQNKANDCLDQLQLDQDQKASIQAFVGGIFKRNS